MSTYRVTLKDGPSLTVKAVNVAGAHRAALALVSPYTKGQVKGVALIPA